MYNLLKTHQHSHKPSALNTFPILFNFVLIHLMVEFLFVCLDRNANVRLITSQSLAFLSVILEYHEFLFCGFENFGNVLIETVFALLPSVP